MGLVSAIGKAVLKTLPANSEIVYRFGKAIVDRYNGDNNCDPDCNGEKRVLKEFLPSAKVIFDVGANQGDWTAEALDVNPNATYHCFEPSPGTFKTLSSRRLPNNVQLSNFGLGDNAGEFTFYVFGDSSPMNSLYDRRGLETKPIGEEKVRIQTLDGYCVENNVERIDFLKIDVEGHELSVLKGGCETLRRGAVKTIQFEYGGSYIGSRTYLKDMFEFLNEINPNYKFYKVFPLELRPAAGYMQQMDTFQYSNWVVKLEADN